MTLDPDSFRNVVGRFATGVTVVTLPSDPPHGITVNAFSSVSLEPPMVLVCIDHDTRAHELLAGGAGGYCVNVLTVDQRELGEYFADLVELDPGPFETEPTHAEVSGAPVFEDALAYLDCTLEAAHEAGDHTVYVGAVETGDVLAPGADPITFYDGQWGTVSLGD